MGRASGGEGEEQLEMVGINVRPSTTHGYADTTSANCAVSAILANFGLQLVVNTISSIIRNPENVPNAKMSFFPFSIFDFFFFMNYSMQK